MKALSLKQPWANLIEWQKKTIETRTWATKYRGDILICSSIKVDRWAMEYDNKIFQRNKVYDFVQAHPLGMALCIVELYDIRPMVKDDEDAALCEVYPKAKSWLIRNVRPVVPFAVKGQLRIFDVPFPN